MAEKPAPDLPDVSVDYIGEIKDFIAKEDAKGSDHLMVPAQYRILGITDHIASQNAATTRYAEYNMTPTTSWTTRSTSSTSNTWTPSNQEYEPRPLTARVWCRCSLMLLVNRVDLNELRRLKIDVLCPDCLLQEATILKEKLEWTCRSGTPSVS